MDIIRLMIERLEVSEGVERSKPNVVLVGDLAAILAYTQNNTAASIGDDGRILMVAGLDLYYSVLRYRRTCLLNNEQCVRTLQLFFQFLNQLASAALSGAICVRAGSACSLRGSSEPSARNSKYSRPSFPSSCFHVAWCSYSCESEIKLAGPDPSHVIQCHSLTEDEAYVV